MLTTIHSCVSAARTWAVTRGWRWRPRLWLAFPYQVVAILIHALYNAGALAFAVGSGAF